MEEISPVVQNVSSAQIPLDQLQLFTDYPPALLDFAATCCVICMLIGVPGNLITIISLARYKKVRNATAIYIINLSCADFLFCCINLPLAATTFATRAWKLGDFMCGLFPFARIFLAAVSVITIVAITANRYIMISYPRLYVRLYTKRNMVFSIAATWIVALAILLPTLTNAWGHFGMNFAESFCQVVDDANGKSPNQLLFLCGFLVPLITISFCYGRIFCIVRKATKQSQNPNRDSRIPERDDSSLGTSYPDPEAAVIKPLPSSDQPPEHPRIQSLRNPSASTAKVSIVDERSSTSNLANNIVKIGRSFHLRKSQILNRAAPSSKDKRLLAMITAIMFTFFICYMPITVIVVFHELYQPTPTAILCSYLMRYLTTCMNPIIYVVMSKEYRKAYKKAIKMPSCNYCKGKR